MAAHVCLSLKAVRTVSAKGWPLAPYCWRGIECAIGEARSVDKHSPCHADLQMSILNSTSSLSSLNSTSLNSIKLMWRDGLKVVRAAKS